MRRKDREVTDIREIEGILLRCRTCRLAMVDDGAPYVVPLSFGYRFTAGGALELYFHSAPKGKKIDVLKKNNQVCFEISCEGEPVQAGTPCESGYYYSSVIGYGEAVFIEDKMEKCEALSRIVKRQTGEDAVFRGDQTEAVSIYKIVSQKYTGKKKTKPDEGLNR